MAARAYIGGEGPCCPPNERQDPVAPGVGDRPLSPIGVGGDMPLFFARDLVANLKKKNYT